jgi:molybdopterin biosynthesis enzyme MoaB
MFKFDTITYHRFLKSQLINFILPIFVNLPGQPEACRDVVEAVMPGTGRRRQEGLIEARNHQG